MHGKRQPPRRHERLGALVDKPGIDQPVGDELAQILRRPRLHARRNFLGEQLEQKIGHGTHRPRFSSRWRLARPAERLQAQTAAGFEFDGAKRALVRAVAERLRSSAAAHHQ